MKKVIKKVLVYSVIHMGGLQILRKLKKTPMVIFWHGVAKSYDPIIEAECIDANTFEEQIAYLKTHYEVISIQDFHQRYIEKSFTNKEAVITFDDGYKNNITVAYPILKKYELPFTVFISTNNISNAERFYVQMPRLIIIGSSKEVFHIPSINKDIIVNNRQEREKEAAALEKTLKQVSLDKALQISKELIENVGEKEYMNLCAHYPNLEMMTWDDLKYLSRDPLCTIGSHTLDHCCCHNKQSISVLEEQIDKSKRVIETIIGKPCNFFAYPNGDYTVSSNNIVKESYLMGFSTIARPVYTQFETTSDVGRIGSAHNTDTFKILISTKANKTYQKLTNAPGNLTKKIRNLYHWFLFRIAQLGLLNPISPKLRPWLWRKTGVKINGSISIGYDVYYDVGNASLITIDDGAWITSRCILLCHRRDMKAYSKGNDINKMPYIKAPIHICKGVHIGMGSIVMPGVTIGEGSIIGAGSIVTKDIPAWSVAVGNPAHIIKQL